MSEEKTQTTAENGTGNNVIDVLMQDIKTAWEKEENFDALQDAFFIAVSSTPLLKHNYYFKKLAKLLHQEKKDIQKTFEDWRKEKQRLEKPKNEDVPEDILAVLKNPEFLQLCVKELDKTITGEATNKLASVVIIGGGRLVENATPTSSNILYNSVTGAGKDHFATQVLRLFPKELVEKRTRISQTALNYWHCQEREPQWSWDGKICYLEDISGSIFNHEVFKIMASNKGGTATITEDGIAKNITIVGKPFLICTAARLVMAEEMQRRFQLLSLDESDTATQAIIAQYTKTEAEGITEEVDEKIICAMKHLKRVKVRVTYADLLSFALPSFAITWRTNAKRWVDFIKASAALHQFQRERNEQGEVLASEKDYEYGTQAFLSTLQNIYALPITSRQKNILAAIQRACEKIEPDEPEQYNPQQRIDTKEEPFSKRRDHAVFKEIEKEFPEDKRRIYELLNSVDKFLEKMLVKEQGVKQKVMAWRVRDDYTNKPSLPKTYQELLAIAEKIGKEGMAGKEGKAGKAGKAQPDCNISNLSEKHGKVTNVQNIDDKPNNLSYLSDLSAPRTAKGVFESLDVTDEEVK